MALAHWPTQIADDPRSELAGSAGLVHVVGGVRGDRGTVYLDHVSPHRREAWGHLLQLQHPSPHRVRPLRDEGHRCGGCSLSHLSAAEELAHKTERLRALARQLPGAPVAVPPIRPAPARTGYRSRAKFVVRAVKGGLVLGGYLPRTHRVVPTTDCPVLEPPVARAARALQDALSRGPWSAYDEASGAGLLRYAAVRSNEAAEVLVTLVVARDPGPQDVDPTPLAGVAVTLREAGVHLVGLTMVVNSSQGNVIFSGREELLWGAPYLAERFGSARVLLSGHAFGQVNRAQATSLYQATAHRALAPLPDGRPVTRIWELYAGAGALSQILVQQARTSHAPARAGVRGAAALEVTAVERDAEATRLARLAAEREGLLEEVPDEGASQGPRLRFVAKDVADFLADFLSVSVARASHHPSEPAIPLRYVRPEVVVLDPPRAGLDARARAALARLAPARLVYVSCNPASLGRDLTALAQAGYLVTELQGFDLMPLTPHLEALAVLEREQYP